ncbi:MAG: hypothetical protein IBX55_17230 [Methyloprofundus sp.]|nr:hypothetical protein [Methyloprofundus sp.]
MENYNKTKLALAMGTAISLVGCLGGGSSGGADPTDPEASSYTISGIATNDLLQSAKVCIDLNSNLKCDSEEPSAITNTSGAFTISTAASEAQDKFLVVEVKSNTPGNSTGKSSVLLSKLPSSITNDLTGQTISPFTTLYDAASNSDKSKILENLGFDNEADLRAPDYQNNQARKVLAEKLAQRIADDLQTGVVSSSITPGQVLLSETGLKAIAKAIADSTSTLTSDSLETILAKVESQAPELEEVTDVKLSLAVKTEGQANIDGASIIVKAYEAGTKTPVIGKNGSTEVSQVIGETDADGRAQLDLPSYALSAVDLQVTVKKEGFVTLEKILKNAKSGDRLPINFTLTSEALETYAVSADAGLDLGSATAASIKSGNPALTFALVRTQNGEEVLLGGQAAAQAMNDGTSDVQVGVQIPLDRVSEEVKAITAGIKGFDPSRAQDSQSFPGSFEGVGLATDFTGVGVNSEARTAGGLNTSSDEVVPIISTSFAQIRLEDQDGNQFELANASEAQSAAEGDNPTIYLRVPSNTYHTITKDAGDDLGDANPLGIQVPIYVYRSGQGWVMIGLATLVSWDLANLKYTNYSGAVNPVVFDGQLFAEIEITAGNEWIQWVNIDWPIVAGEVVDHSFNGRVRYDGEQAEPFNGYGYVQFDDGSQEWIYATNGRFNFSRPTTPTNAASATAYLFNENTYQYESFDFVASDDSNTLVLSPNPALLTNPFSCQVEGQVVKNGEPVSWRSIQLNSQNGNFWRYAYSDYNGNFKSVVPCNETVNLAVSGTTAEFNVDNSKAANESSDDGKTVVLSAVELPNQPPSVWGYTETNRLIIPVNGSADLNLSAYGYDSDSQDITFEWTCPGGASAAYVYTSASHTCAIDSSHLAGQDAGTLNWSVKVTDTEGASSTYNGRIQAELANINRAPKIWRVERGNADGSGLIALSCSRQDAELVCRDRVMGNSAVSYKVVATDPDGDTLTYGLNGTNESDNLFTDQQVSSEIAFTVQDQRDDAGSEPKTSRAKVITEVLVNQAPSVYLGLSRYNLVKGSDDTLTIYAYMWDDFTRAEDLTVSFELDSSVVYPQLNNGVWTLDISGYESGTYSLALTVTDEGSKATTSSVSFTIGNSQLPQIYDAKLSFTNLELGYSPAPTFSAQVWDERVADLDILIGIYQNDSLLQTLTPTLEGYRVTANLPTGLEVGTYEVRLTIQDQDNDPVTSSLGFNVTDTAETGSDTIITIQ